MHSFGHECVLFLRKPSLTNVTENQNLSFAGAATRRSRRWEASWRSRTIWSEEGPSRIWPWEGLGSIWSEEGLSIIRSQQDIVWSSTEHDLSTIWAWYGLMVRWSGHGLDMSDTLRIIYIHEHMAIILFAPNVDQYSRAVDICILHFGVNHEYPLWDPQKTGHERN